MMSAFRVIDVHKSIIMPGDCIVHNGKEVTVSISDIRIDHFFGRLIFGDSYNLGYKLVKKLVYINPKIKK